LENTIESVVLSLKQLIEKYNKRIYLFAAGIARHHDSIQLYEQVVSMLNKEFNTSYVSVIYERNPFILTKYIKHASIWIGTSLHGRIIAIAYSVPRVSLTNGKVAGYVSEWDNGLPYNIGLKDLLDSCDIALNFEISKLDSIASSLESKAFENFNNNIGL
jgi:hypothetical protein